MKRKITGIILAGGKSQRMGTVKGMVPFRGRPLIDYAIGLLGEFSGEIMISANTSDYNDFGIKVVKDITPNIGPMGGIHSCLRESTTPVNIVLSCDMPFVTPEVIRHLLDHSRDALVTVPWYGNEHYEPLCGIYHKDSIPEMEKLIRQGNYKLPDLFKKIQVNRLEVNREHPVMNWPQIFFSINSPEDLDSAEKFLHT